MQTTITPAQPPLPTITSTAVRPPLPVENKPPLPPEEPPINQMVSSYTTMPTKISQGHNSTMISHSSINQRHNWSQKRSYDQETEYQHVKKPFLDQWSPQKEIIPVQTVYNQPPPQPISSKSNVEELSEAEKKFDKEFAAWEAQFQKWKEQNVNHPDKTQYREYEKKWESWRNSLLERREQMRKKRLALAGGTTSVSSKIPNFSQPPPTLNQQVSLSGVQQSLINQNQQMANEPSTLLLPHENNEPLSFKNESDQVISEGSFLGTATSSGVIPGLDLVKDNGKDSDLDGKDSQNKGPDLEAISKGINTILGDQKLLNMLSMVTKHPPPTPGLQNKEFTILPPVSNYQEGVYGNMSLPPPAVPYREHYNDQSNHSYEDRSNQDDYHQRETVTNFDDQTRSSFTMAPNELDQNFRQRNQSVRFGDDKCISTPKNNLVDSSAPKSLLSLTFPPGGPKMMSDDYSSAVAKKSDKFGSGSGNPVGQIRKSNFRQGQKGLDKFGSNTDFGVESFANENRGGTLGKKSRFENENFGKFGSDFQDEHDHYDNFNPDRTGNYESIGSHNFSESYNQTDEYDNYTEYDDFDKYHTMFNEEEQDYQEEKLSYDYDNRGEYTNPGFQDEHYHPQQPLVASKNIAIKPHLLTEPDVSVPNPSSEDAIIEPAKVIDYEHKSLRQRKCILFIDT